MVSLRRMSMAGLLLASGSEAPVAPPGELPVVVNEIMYAPPGREPEWIELRNCVGEPVNIRKWQITDASAARHTLPARDILVPPGGYVLLTKDSAALVDACGALPCQVVGFSGFPSLNNSGDAIVIRDASGVLVDSVTYDPAWHNPDLADPEGRSLERVSPGINSNDRRNWGTCVHPTGGTPGASNSISVPLPPGGARLSCSPNPFSPDGDGVDEVVVIHYELPVRTSIVSLTIYDVRGRLIRRVANCEPGGFSGNIIWDGRDDAGAAARIGIYVALLEAANSDGALQSAKGVLVLARPL